MQRRLAEKPATALRDEPASEIDQLGGKVDFQANTRLAKNQPTAVGHNRAESRRFDRSTRIAHRPKYSHLEICLNYSPAGFRSWSVMTRDLEFGLRHVKTFFTKAEAVASALRMSRRVGVDIRRGPMSAKQIKRAEFQMRQRRVAVRAAKRAVQP